MMINYSDKARGLTGLHTALEGLLSTIEQIPLSGGGGGSATDANFIDWVGRVTISALNTTAKTVKGAINELNTLVGAHNSSIAGINANIGAMTGLDTTAKDSLVNAINELCEDLIVYEDYTFNVSYTGIAVGTRAFSGTQTASKDGYTPVAAYVANSSSTNGIVTPILSGSTLYCIAYSTKTSAVNFTATVRVAFVKSY